MGKNNQQIDADTLLAIAKALKAKGKIDKIDMESKSFVEMVLKEAKSAGIGLFNEAEGWISAIGKELDAWGKAAKKTL